MKSDAVTQNLKLWMENPTWKAYYEDAPSRECKDYIAMDFYASETESYEAFREMDRMLKNLSKTDIQYLYERAIGPEKGKFANLLSQM